MQYNKLFPLLKNLCKCDRLSRTNDVLCGKQREGNQIEIADYAVGYLKNSVIVEICGPSFLILGTALSSCSRSSDY